MATVEMWRPHIDRALNRASSAEQAAVMWQEWARTLEAPVEQLLALPVHEEEPGRRWWRFWRRGKATRAACSWGASECKRSALSLHSSGAARYATEPFGFGMGAGQLAGDAYETRRGVTRIPALDPAAKTVRLLVPGLHRVDRSEPALPSGAGMLRGDPWEFVVPLRG